MWAVTHSDATPMTKQQYVWVPGIMDSGNMMEIVVNNFQELFYNGIIITGQMINI